MVRARAPLWPVSSVTLAGFPPGSHAGLRVRCRRRGRGNNPDRVHRATQVGVPEKQDPRHRGRSADALHVVEPRPDRRRPARRLRTSIVVAPDPVHPLVRSRSGPRSRSAWPGGPRTPQAATAGGRPCPPPVVEDRGCRSAVFRQPPGRRKAHGAITFAAEIAIHSRVGPEDAGAGVRSVQEGYG